MPKGKQKYKKLKKRIVKLWLPTAVIALVFITVIWFLTESYNRQILGDSTSLPGASFFSIGFLPSKGLRNTQNAFDYFKKQVSQEQGNFSIFIENMDNGTEYSLNPSSNFYAASLYKVPVAVSALMYLEDNKLTLDSTTTLFFSDFSDGTGVLGKYSAGTKLTYREIIENLLKESDNTAQSLLLRVVPQKYLDKGFSLNKTFVWNPEFMLNNETNSRAYSAYLSTVYHGNELSTENRNFLFSTMEHTSFDDRIYPFLKTGAIFSHKIGSWGDTNNWHDCGIVLYQEEKYVVCVMSNQTSFDTFKEVAQATAQFVNTLLN